jgi:hypothetical protein
MPSRSKTQSLAETTTTTTVKSDRGGETYSRREKDEVDVEERSGDGKDECDKKGWSSGGKKRGWGYASMYLWVVIAPIVIYIILFTLKPGFVTDTVNGACVLNNQKLCLWCLIASVAAWILIYAAYACRY